MIIRENSTYITAEFYSVSPSLKSSSVLLILDILILLFIYMVCTSEYINNIFIVLNSFDDNPANENGLKWIEMDSDFQKYWFTNVKMNAFQSFQSWMHFYLFIEYPLHGAYLYAFQFKNNISFFCVLWILFNSKFWIEECSFSIQLNPIKSN